MTHSTDLPTFFRDLAIVMAAAASLAGCSTPNPGPRLADGYSAQQVSNTRHQVVRSAGRLVGTPYRYGGNTPKGFDCSGLVQYTHREAGIEVPRTTASQLSRAHIPDRRNLLPGDLLFFEIDWQKSRHVGIYEGDGVFIHAPSSGKRVSRASLDNPYWSSRLIATRSFL